MLNTSTLSVTFKLYEEMAEKFWLEGAKTLTVGQPMRGGVRSTAVTVNVQVFGLPKTSVAVHVTLVGVMGNVNALGKPPGEQERVTGNKLLSVAVTLRTTLAVFVNWPVEGRKVERGQFMTGA